MNQALALEILLAGHNVMLTGPAGSGKTYVLNQFIELAKKSGKSVSVTATTGLAATHLGGNTIHAWSGIGIDDELPKNFLDHLSKTRREIIEKANILIIDEISMLHDFRLDIIEQAARLARQNDQPFGGLQIVLCGDFFQLPPVNRADSRTGSFVVNSQAWQMLDPVICYLGEQHRQDDQELLEILNALRAGDVRRRHAETLLGRVDANLDQAETVTELHTINTDVDRINAAALDAIEDDYCTYYMNTTGSQNYIDTLKRSCLALEELVLKKGALVMCIKNNPERRYVNGSLGVVVDFEELTNYPRVQLRSGKTVTISPEIWELRDGTKKRASITQIPLRLAWAITVHKSQGMTLDAARIDLRKAFVEGMGYVALSRVRSLKTLSLSGINKMALKVSPEALEIDQLLRQRSEAAMSKFASLLDHPKAQKVAGKKKNTASGAWASKIEKMREAYPNAFRPWSAEDDQKLKTLFTDGKGTAEITELLGRQPGSIAARLKKHFGDNIVLRE